MGFNKKRFFKITLSYFLMAGIWTFIAIQYGFHPGEYRNNLVWGFIPIYALAFVIGSGFWKNFKGLAILAGFICTFLFVSFIVLPLLVQLTNSDAVASIVLSLAAMTAINLILNRVHKNHYLIPTIVIAAACALPSYYIMDYTKDVSFVRYNINPTIILFNLWQGFTIIPIAAGLSLGPNKVTGPIRSEEEEGTVSMK